MRGIVVHQIGIRMNVDSGNSAASSSSTSSSSGDAVAPNEGRSATKCDYVDNASPLAIAKYISMQPSRQRTGSVYNCV